MASLVPIPPFHLPDVWPSIEGMIAAAEARSGRRTSEDIYQQIRDGHSQLWLAWGDGPVAVALTEIHTFPLVKVLRFTMATGFGRAGWLDFMQDIEAWGKSQGCTISEPIARPGWERVLKPLGYRATHTILEKPL